MPPTKSNQKPPPHSACAERVKISRSLSAIFFALLVGVFLHTSCSPASGETVAGQQNPPQTRERRAQSANDATGAAGANRTDRTEMAETKSENSKSPATTPVSFYTALEKALKKRKLRLETICDINDSVSRRVLEDYGAMYLAADNVMPPPVCIFRSEEEALRFQEEARPVTAVVGGARIELQAEAMNALMRAREEARASGLDITPRGGEEAARRTYTDTLRLWNTRFLPALAHWSKLKRLTQEQVTRLRNLPLHEQVREVLELEKSGIFFSKDFSKSILYSIAAPGTSQHLAMLALDVDQFADERVRRILARHGWFQTVKSDLPHFTYLGLEEKDLPAHGLRPVVFSRQLFWIPNVTD